MIRISHPEGIIKAGIHLPASKSLSNRAIIIRYLSNKNFPLYNLSDSGDTQLLQSILSDVPQMVNAEDAGTVFRFLTAVLATKPGSWTMTGTERLKERPVSILVDALRTLGAKITYAGKEGFAPLKIEGRDLSGGVLEMDASVSSQFISALLMIAPLLKEGLRISLKGKTASLPYIHMTLKMMEHFGVKHEWVENTIAVEPQEYKPVEYTVEADWSAASYWFETAALAKEAEIDLYGLSSNSQQGDSRMVTVFDKLGVNSEFFGEGLRIKKDRNVHLPGTFMADCYDVPDLAPALIATCAGLKLKASITGLHNLDDKESRRKSVLVNELKSKGIEISDDSSSVKLNGGTFQPQSHFNTHHDHRMAMCFAPLALRNISVLIDEPEAVKKSYPEFWEDLRKAGFNIHLPDM